MLTQPANLTQARNLLLGAKNLVVLTGAGVSGASGIPTFRGAGGLWRRFRSEELATPEAFRRNPSVVWAFYHWRRELVRNCRPNATHEVIARLQAHPPPNLASAILITQNVDGLHPLSGSEAIEMHGSLFRTRCTNSKCKESKRDVENRDSPISEGLRGRGAPDAHDEPEVPLDGLPKCSECGSLTRPAVVWFGEMLDPNVLERCHAALASCDLLFVIGTAGAVYPAAGFADQVMGHGGHVVEFNLERTRLDTPAGKKGGTYLFIEGKCEETVPAVLESAIARH